MEADRKIITDNEQIYEAILRHMPDDKVLLVSSRFIDFTGVTADFEPCFVTTDAKEEANVKRLSGEVICALPPCLPGPYRAKVSSLSDNFLLFAVARALAGRPASVYYAPLPSLQPDDIKNAINAAPIKKNEDDLNLDPWFITAIAAGRVTQFMIASKVQAVIAKDEALEKSAFTQMGWMSYYYLHIINSLSQPWWTCQLEWGSCRADEIDAFGASVRHPKRPDAINAEVKVTEKITEGRRYPDPRFRLNELIQKLITRKSDMELPKLCDELRDAYAKGRCTWPFRYGSEHYGEPDLALLGNSNSDTLEIISQLQNSKKADRIMRLYTQKPLPPAAPNATDPKPRLFRSISYYDGKQALSNEIPKREMLKLKRTLHPAQSTITGFLDYLSSQELNIDLEAYSRLISGGYVQQQGQDISLTDSGKALIRVLEEAHLNRRVLYLILRALENIKRNQSGYNDVMSQIAETLQWEPEGTKSTAQLGEPAAP